MQNVLSNAGREGAELPGIEHLTLAGGEQGLSGLSVWRQSMAPGSATPPHQHDCEEVVLVARRTDRLPRSARVGLVALRLPDLHRISKLVVDAKDGLTPADETLADTLRKSDKPVILTLFDGDRQLPWWQSARRVVCRLRPSSPS